MRIARVARRGRPRHFIDLWILPSLNPDGRAAHTRQNARDVDLDRFLPMAAGARRSLLPRAACRIGAGDPDRHAPHPADRTRHHDLVPSAARVGGRIGRPPGRPNGSTRPLGRLAARSPRPAPRDRDVMAEARPSGHRGVRRRASGAGFALARSVDTRGRCTGSYPHAADAKDRHIDTVPNLTERDAPDVRRWLSTPQQGPFASRP